MLGLGTVALVAIGLIAWAVISVLMAMSYRTVVATNEVHIVQSRRKTTSYGKDQVGGNTYYAWPAWMPRIGIRIIKLPVSVFDIKLDAYDAYDKGRVPFKIDVLAFFRIENSNEAAQRVSSFAELEHQLEGILQGASRSILAQSPIEEILEERAKYGQMFTEATNDQLKAWGVTNVKNVELMDIRDQQGGEVIKNIMAVKASTIARDSRIAVANNMQAAQTAEINAQQTVLVRKQEADEQVGIRTAQKDQAIGIAGQKAQQAVKEEEKGTAERQMNVLEVTTVRQAEIQRDAQVVAADQSRQIVVIESDAQKQQAVLIADGKLEAAKRNAEAIEVEGKAHGSAETAILMAPVNSQIALAHEIGQNEGYQKYLVTVRQIEAGQIVGVEQAKALEAADIKIIANSAGPVDGIKTVAEMFSAKGGQQFGAALEGLSNTDVGAEIISAVTGAIRKQNGIRP